MLKIRLQRTGRNKVSTFRIVVTESKNGPKSGKSLEVLGVYDPVNDVKEIKVDRVKYWLSQGVGLSGTMHNFLVDRGIISGAKRNVISRRKASDTSSSKKEEKSAQSAEQPKDSKDSNSAQN